MLALALVGICVVFGALGQISMKTGMTQIGSIETPARLFNPYTLVHVLSNGYVLLGLLLYGIATILWLGALSQLQVSYIYPLLSLAYVITALLAVLFLGETVTFLRWTGITLVVIGAFLINRS